MNGQDIMAEFLIYKGPNWMDSLKPSEVNKMNWQRKRGYARRFQRGDIVETREDGTFKDIWNENSKFYLLKVPGLSYDRDYHRPLLRAKTN